MHPEPARSRSDKRTLATAQGACPNCGDLVPRLRRRLGGAAAETFACSNCGRFTYKVAGSADLPLVVPVPLP